MGGRWKSAGSPALGWHDRYYCGCKPGGTGAGIVGRAIGDAFAFRTCYFSSGSVYVVSAASINTLVFGQLHIAEGPEIS